MKTHFSLNISFSCSVQTFINCRALYTFIGSSIRPFMLMNFTRLCSESYIMGGITESCLICFSLFYKKKKDQMRCQHLVHLLKHMANTSTPFLSHVNTETVVSCLQCNIRVPTSCSERPSMISEISCSLLAIVAERPVPLCPTLQRRIFPNVIAVDIASEATVSLSSQQKAK